MEPDLVLVDLLIVYIHGGDEERLNDYFNVGSIFFCGYFGFDILLR